MHFIISKFTIYILSVFQAVNVIGNVPQEYCQKETFKPRCWKNDVILVTTALYGRMNIGRCLTVEDCEQSMMSNPKYLGCSVDVEQVLSSRCSGKPSCDVQVWDDELQKLNPCLKGLVSHMEAAYICINSITETENCHIKALPSSVPSYLSSSQTRRARQCGTPSRPWVVEAPVGQQIRISLLNLNSTSWSLNCPFSMGFVQETKAGKKKEFCLDRLLKLKEIYVSSKNRLEIVMVSDEVAEKKLNQSSEAFFLEIKAIGCSDLIPAEDAWLKRNNNEATVGCYSSRQTWQLRCNGHQWIGVLGNCSNANTPGAKFVVDQEESRTEKLMDKNLELLGIIAISGVGLAVCCLIVGIGYLCSKKYSTKESAATFKDSPNDKMDLNYYNSHRLLQKETNVETAAASEYGDSSYFVLDEVVLREDKIEK